MSPYSSKTTLTHALALILLAVAMTIPQSADARERRGQQSSQANEQEELFPKATRKAPDQKVSPGLRSTINELFDAYKDKDTATAIQLADEVIANQKAGAYEHALAARIAGISLVNTDNDKAQAYLEQAIAFNGLSNNEHYESMRYVAQMDLMAQRFDKSLATIDRYLSETHAQDSESLLVKGSDLYRLKRYPEAITTLKSAIDQSQDPKPEWYELLMGAYFDSNQPQEAARIAEELIAKHPDDKKLQLSLAASYLEAGQDDKATALLEKLRTGGGLASAEEYNNLYATYINHNKNKEGIAVIQEGLQKGVLKEDFHTLNALAQAYWFSDQPEQAIAAYRKAAPLAPDGKTYLNLARALINEGRTDEAKQAAKQALDKGGIDPAVAKKILGL